MLKAAGLEEDTKRDSTAKDIKMADTKDVTTGAEADTTVTTETSENKSADAKATTSTTKRASKPLELFDDLEPRVTLSSRHKNSFYLQRARRLLRLYDEIKILGGSNDISRACLVVELLKKEETGVVASLETRMQLSSLNAKGEFGRPQPVIEFVVRRGNYGQFVSGFAQRKMIELFEKQAAQLVSTNEDEEDGDEKMVENNNSNDYRLNSDKETYELSEDCVRKIGLEGVFYATEEKIREADEFLRDCSSKNGGFISLPQFIQYASLLINPKLKNIQFRRILKHKFKLNVGKYGMIDDEDDEEEEHGDAHGDEEDANKHDDDDEDDVQDIE